MINKLKIKKAVKKFLSGFKSTIPIPFDFNVIQRAYPNITIRRYSEFKNKYNISYKNILSYFGSDDAVCDYNAKENKYIIAYNDFDIMKLNCFRYRFSIAHELGHIFLNHLDDKRTRIFRSEISESEYTELENEADQFAAYILCPHSVLLGINIPHHSKLSSICCLSKFASERRYVEFREWLKNRDIIDMEKANPSNVKLDWFDLLLNKKFIKVGDIKCPRR